MAARNIAKPRLYRGLAGTCHWCGVNLRHTWKPTEAEPNPPRGYSGHNVFCSLWCGYTRGMLSEGYTLGAKVTP